MQSSYSTPVMSKRKNSLPTKKHAQLVAAQQSWTGPLPDPHSVEHYSRILPDAPKIIFAEFESDSQHRRAMEKKAANLEIFLALAVYALLAAFFVTSVWFFIKGNNIAGCALVSAPVIVAFVKALRKKR